MLKWLVKLVANGAVLITFLMWFTDAPFAQIGLFAVVLSTVAFLLGDQIILPLSNNSIATLADAGLAGLLLWAADRTYGWGLSSTQLFLTVIVLAVVEWLYHMVLADWDRGKYNPEMPR